MAFQTHPGILPVAGVPPFVPVGVSATPTQPRGPEPSGSSQPVTVFVGNITERAPDRMVRQMLTACGRLLAWKRVQGASGSLQAFGFGEYELPGHALRAIRLLHDIQLADKRLVVKVDGKTKNVLDDYKRERVRRLGGDVQDDEADLIKLDPDAQAEDRRVMQRVQDLLHEHQREMMNFVPERERRFKGGGGGRFYDSEFPPPHFRDDHLSGPRESLKDVDMEDGKRDIIHREIGKFRETMKLREAEKEKEEKLRREKEDDVMVVGGKPGPGRRRSPDSSGFGRGRRTPPDSGSGGGFGRARRTRSRSRSRTRDRDSRPRDREGRGGFGSRFSSPGRRRRSNSRRRNRSRSRSHSPDRRRSRSPVALSSRSSKDSHRDREKEEEERENRKLERKARDKEAAYQERLRKWESREVKKQQTLVTDKRKERQRLIDEEEQGQKLREFLEDYDDERDDPKYYKGREMERRMDEREGEALGDEIDRQKEKSEIDMLRAQVMKEGHRDPSAELQRRLELQNRVAAVPEPTDEVHQLPGDIPQLPPSVQDGASNAVAPYANSVSPPRDDANSGLSDINDNSPETFEPTSLQQINPADVSAPATSFEASPSAPPVIAEVPSAPKPSCDANMPQKQQPSSEQPAAKQPVQVALSGGRKKLYVAEAFSQDSAPAPPKSSNHHHKQHRRKDEARKKPTPSAEDKRRHIKSLIDKIPTDKDALFAYDVEWDLVDTALMEKRIQPWVNKKIAEYIGEPEPTLTEFICSKVLAGATPAAVLEDVQMVLDEEAEVFVVKLWRLLIYETESKRHKAGAAPSSSSSAKQAAAAAAR